MSLTLPELRSFVGELAATPDTWQRLVRHDTGGRMYEQIWDDERVNAWVICWSDGQDTGFHDHDDSGAAIAVISGHVCEERLRFGDAPQARVFGPGSTFTVPAVAIHRVVHVTRQPAVTVHAYSPPLTRTGAYRIGPAGELLREALSYEEELRAEAALNSGEPLASQVALT
jgi:quercetin dioxygenase-like cupin family protein